MTYNKQMSYHFVCIHTKQKRTGYIIYYGQRYDAREEQNQ